ncbi:glycosyltransferase 61 family protein [Dinoroseobacter shibae]|jgi:hypothetical protein|uniref:glycosyltransferase 61 family protein n=1 Tax=Dinoroseobacter shibae TaxID=215813 RepID=UPI0002FB49B1|nr:glycosyltransferase 61 family protein [Dinoroseobacter shibae]URF47394.1 glycosyltransferase 61 family protein [Dinoroseobacter shibae]URF51705.1 glycosyltransferase 61 family protein [Dinoroseobacter shibae]
MSQLDHTPEGLDAALGPVHAELPKITPGKLPSLVHEVHTKTILHRHCAPEDGFARLRGMLIPQLWDVLQAEGTVLRIVDRPTAPCTLEPPRVPGPGKPMPVPRVPRVVAGGWLKDVTLFKRSPAIRKGDRLILDRQGDELARVPVELGLDPAFYQQDGDHVYHIEDRAEDRVMRLDRAISVMGLSAEAFGHWLYGLLRLCLTLRDDPELEGVPVLIDADMPGQHRQSIALFSGGRHEIIRVPRRHRVEVGTLFAQTSWLDNPQFVRGDHLSEDGVVRDLNIFGAHMPKLARLFRDAGAWADTVLTPQPEDAKRLFIRRTPPRYRKLVNTGRSTAISVRWATAISASRRTVSRSRCGSSGPRSTWSAWPGRPVTGCSSPVPARGCACSAMERST